MEPDETPRPTRRQTLSTSNFFRWHPIPLRFQDYPRHPKIRDRPPHSKKIRKLFSMLVTFLAGLCTGIALAVIAAVIVWNWPAPARSEAPRYIAVAGAGRVHDRDGSGCARRFGGSCDRPAQAPPVFGYGHRRFRLVGEREVGHPATARLRLFRGWQQQKSREDFAMKSLAYATILAFALTPSYGFAQASVKDDERRRAD